MMVETMLESSQDFGMSNGSLPQWKRELLQRRAARSRPPAAPAAPPPPPPPPPADEDEELRYGPGIVKRLKSRYLSLALREAPRRRPSVLRRATSLEHLLDERPPPAPRPHARATRPVSLAAPSHALAARASPRRDSVKRARSVDALSRLDSRDESPQLHLPPALDRPEPPVQGPVPPPPPPPLPRSTRPPRRPAPLLRETERPPPDVVRSTLRKFEAAPTRRPASAARVPAVLRGLEAPPRSSTPEPRGRSPSPAAADLSAIDEPEGALLSAEAKPVSRAALEGIARAGSTVRYSFEAGRRGAHLPPLAATNPVMLSRARPAASPRRVGVIRPMPAPDRLPASPPPDRGEDKPEETARITSPATFETESPPSVRQERREPPPSALVEPCPRPPQPPAERPPSPARDHSTGSPGPRDESPAPEVKPAPSEDEAQSEPLVNGHATMIIENGVEVKREDRFSKIGAAGIERAWTGAKEKCSPDAKDSVEIKSVVSWVRSVGGAGGEGAGRRLRTPAPAATSVVFNFSDRKEVPDHIVDDGVVRRTNRRNCFKAGEPGVVLLRADALEPSDSEDEEETRPPSPCSVRFVNDNVLINGKSSMAATHNKLAKDRAAKLKLQFDDSLTRTFEYPSEISLCEDSPADAHAPTSAHAVVPATASAAPPAQAHASALTANTHIVSAALSQYTPSKTVADSFALGVARRPDENDRLEVNNSETSAAEGEAEAEAEAGDARPCAAESARSWSEARTHHTDLLF